MGDEWIYVGEAWVVGTHEIPEAIATRLDMPTFVDEGDVVVLLQSGSFQLYESEAEFRDAGYEWVAEDDELDGMAGGE